MNSFSIPLGVSVPFKSVALLDLRESVRARWFLVYLLIFGGAVVILISLGITESQVMGFTGLTRMLITYFQLCIAILPVFILITTVRTVVGERESNVLEYLLSMPIPLGAYYWGKLSARFLVVFLPVFAALTFSIAWGTLQNLAVPWQAVSYYTLMLATLSWCFLGLGMLLSTLVRKQEWALGLAFLSWLLLLLFLDAVLIGVMLQHKLQEEVIIFISLLNPLQVFRTGAMLLFDPELTILGPASYVILDFFGKQGYLIFCIAYPMLLGWIFSLLGFRLFKKGDLV